MRSWLRIFCLCFMTVMTQWEAKGQTAHRLHLTIIRVTMRTNEMILSSPVCVYTCERERKKEGWVMPLEEKMTPIFHHTAQLQTESIFWEEVCPDEGNARHDSRILFKQHVSTSALHEPKKNLIFELKKASPDWITCPSFVSHLLLTLTTIPCF